MTLTIEQAMDFFQEGKVRKLLQRRADYGG